MAESKHSKPTRDPITSRHIVRDTVRNSLVAVGADVGAGVAMSAAQSYRLGSGPIPSLAAIGSALAALPESERYAFAEALAARALAWRRTASGATHAPIVVRVEPDPSMADVDEAEPEAFDPGEDDE